MSFASNLRDELLELKMWDINSNMKQDEQLARLCIREAFIKAGSMSDPNKRYHLQIIFKQKKKAEEIKNLLLNFNIHAKIIKKDKEYMLYLKDGEEISNFLALIGASKSMLKFEEIRVLKETRNNINRIVNCETANLNKTINASVEQIKAIEAIRKIGKFEELPVHLKEIASLRVENPDASLVELGKMLNKPIGKSGVNHRLKKLLEIAENYIRGN